MPSVYLELDYILQASQTTVSQLYHSITRLPSGLSFFDPHLQYFTKETLESGGSAYLSWDPNREITGLFIYDDIEHAGSIFTKSREAFDHFYTMKKFNYLFSELDVPYKRETYDIYTMNLAESVINHRFKYQVFISREADADNISRFMRLTHPKTNPEWVRVALENGERCIMMHFEDEIIAAGWVSLVNRIGRLTYPICKSTIQEDGHRGGYSAGPPSLAQDAGGKVGVYRGRTE